MTPGITVQATLVTGAHLDDPATIPPFLMEAPAN